MKICIEDQFLGGNMREKRTEYCWNDVLVMYLINTNYVVSFVINNMIAITVIFCLLLLSYGFDIFFVILNCNAFWKVWSVIFCEDFVQTFHVFSFLVCYFELDHQQNFKTSFWNGWGVAIFIQQSTNHFSTSWSEEKYSPGYFLGNMANCISSYFTFLFLFPSNGIRITF